MRVIGIDGCRKGWFGIVTGGGGVEALFPPRVADLVASAGGVAAIAIDIPIGLPDRGVRRAADGDLGLTPRCAGTGPGTARNGPGKG